MNVKQQIDLAAQLLNISVDEATEYQFLLIIKERFFMRIHQ